MKCKYCDSDLKNIVDYDLEVYFCEKCNAYYLDNNGELIEVIIKAKKSNNDEATS